MKIIDGADVSGCTDYCINKCFDEPNCTFKQLKRCKAKLEKIKEIAKENNICEGFGCIPMYKILKVIEGAENE